MPPSTYQLSMECWQDFPCVETTWPLDHYGYGQRYGGRVNGRQLPNLRSNRVALEEKLGRALFPGMKALHHCDNPPCIQSEHLYEGTQSQNMHDMYARDRHPRDCVKAPRLSDAVRAEVRRQRGTGLTQDDIARALGIGQGSVSRILAEGSDGSQVR